MSKLLVIKIPNIIEPTGEDVYVMDGKYVDSKLKGALVFYSAAPPGKKPLTLGQTKLSFKQVTETLKKCNIPYREVSKFKPGFLTDVRQSHYASTYNLHSLVVALLLTVEFEEKLFFTSLQEILEYLPLYSKEEPRIISPKFLKPVLLSASRINFHHLQLLSISYDIVWNSISQGQDFASLFTKEEATQIYEKIFTPEPDKDDIIITPGWMRLFCKVKKADAVYEEFLSQVEKVRIHPLSFCRIRENLNTYGSERIILRLLYEKKPKVFIISRFPQSGYLVRYPDMDKPLQNNNLAKAMSLLILVQHLIELEEWLYGKEINFWHLVEVEGFTVEPELFKSLIVELKTLIETYFSSSPFMVLLFCTIQYITFRHTCSKESAKIFLDNLKDFLLSIPNSLLKRQVFNSKKRTLKEIPYLNEFILATLLFAKPDVNLVETLIRKCVKIRNFPLEVFLFYPEVRKCKNYNKLVLKVATSGKRVINYIELLKIIERDKEFYDMTSLPKEYEAIYSDVKENIPINVVRKILQKRYVIDGIENKVKVLALSSEKDRIMFKRYLILKEVGLHKGDIHEVVNIILDTHKVFSLYDLIKFVGECAKKMNNDEFEFLTRMLSCFIKISRSHVHITLEDSNAFLKNINIEHAISALRKIKKPAKEESQ